jgi:thiol-disulfide isomerase/thioredoxin
MEVFILPFSFKFPGKKTTREKEMNLYLALALAVFLLIVAYVLVFAFPTKSDPPRAELPLQALQALQASPKPPIGPSALAPNNVRDLVGNESAEAFLADKSPGLLMVYAPWCGHCKNMMPAYESASTKTQRRFARLEGSTAQSFLQKHEIRGFPTLLTVGPAGVARYAGGRDENSLLAGINAL